LSYWITSLGLIAFGLVGMLSIGRPFFLVGLAMLILGPLRRRPALYWPPLVAVIAYNVGWWAVAPMYCTATQAVGGASTTACSSLIGINYSGPGIYNPSLEPANQAGVLMAVVVFVVAVVAMLRKGRPDRVGPSGPPQDRIQPLVSPMRSLATAGIGAAWVVGYLLIIQSQGTEMGTPGVVFYATFVSVMAALSLGAAVLCERDPRWAQTLLYAAVGGYLPAGVLGLASVGLPLIVAGLLALSAAGPRLVPVRLGLAAGALSAGLFLAGVAVTIRVS
jgi:hypothetical protein